MIDLDTSKPVGMRLEDFNFVTSNARQFQTISVTIAAGDTDPTQTVIQELSKYELEEAIVRLHIKIPGELEPSLRESDIRNVIDRAYFVASISREVLDQPRTRLGDSYSKGLDTNEILKLYFDSRSLPDDRTEILMRHAQGLMEEETSE